MPLRRLFMRQRPSLRLTILAILVVVLLPALGVAGLTLFKASQSFQEASRRQLLETARTVARAAQRELALTASVVRHVQPLRLRALAQSASEEPVLDNFANGQLQWHNLQREGAAWSWSQRSVVSVELKAIVERAAQTGQLQVSNLQSSGDVAMPWQLVLAVPHTDGAAAQQVVTSLTTAPEHLLHALSSYAPENSSVILAITDGQGRILERSVDSARFMGQVVPDWPLLQQHTGDSGVITAQTLEGREIIFAFQRMEGTPGWVAVAGEAASSFHQRTQQPIQLMLVATGAALCVALALALWLVRKVLQPIQQLAARAHAMAAKPDTNGAPVPAVPAAWVAEFEALRQSLDRADEVLQHSLQESRRAEHEAQAHLTILQTAEEQARLGHWTLNVKTQQLWCSDMIGALFGNAQVAVQMPLLELRQSLSADSFERMLRAAQQCALQGTPYALELEHVRVGGSILTVYVRGWAQCDDAGHIHSIAGTLQDISEGKEQRERLSALADNLPSGAIFRLARAADRSLSVEFFSAGLEGLTGYAANAVQQHPELWLRAMKPTDVRRLLRVAMQAQRSGQVLDSEFALRTAQGQTVWLHCRAALRYPPTGGAVWDGIVRDVTAERAAEAALRAAKDAAEEAERAKSDFLATMSHEIRTPMNSVIGMARLALRTDLDAQQRNYLEKINASANVLMDIINDILDFSKIEAGGLSLEQQPLRLQDVLHTVSAVTALRAEEKGLSLTMQIGPQVPAMVRGDALRLGQVLTNLVSNAVKFTARGSVALQVSVLPGGAQAQLYFAVTDTGIGLTPAQMERLFQPFSQAQSDTTRHYGGTGLGLAISKRLVELMGGRIGVHSQAGVGSCFFFTVALEEANDTLQPERISISHSTDRALDASAYERLRGLLVLVADDNALNREVAAEFLAQVGVRTVFAEDGAQALQVLQSQSVDAVLMDIHMPHMNGLAAARAIRQQPRWQHLPIIALTAQARPEDVQLSLEAGMQAHLTKPMDEHALYGTLLALCLADEQLRSQTTALSAVHPESIKQPALALDAGEPELPQLTLRIGASPQRQAYLLRGFLQDFEAVPERALQAWQGQQWQVLAELAHKVKGSAGYLGAHALIAVADALEAAANNSESSRVAHLTPQFVQAMQQCLQAVRQLIVALEAEEAPQDITTNFHALEKKAKLGSPVYALLAQLEPLVASGNFAANDLLEQLVQMGAGTVWHAAAQAAQEAFADLELDQAQMHLRSVAQHVHAA